MYEPDLSKVRFTGPLAPFAAGWREVLVGQGYVACSAALKLQLAAHFSCWLQAQGLEAKDASEAVITEFLTVRRATHTAQVSLEALGPFVDYLRSLQVIPEPGPDVPVCEQEILLAQYQQYLLARRGLSGPVITAYGHWIMPFLDHLQATGCRAQDGEVSGEVIADYLTSRLVGLSRKSAKMTTSVLRSFLGFLHVAGYSRGLLTGAVPPIVSYRHSGLPQPLTQNETAALLGAVDPNTTAGKRDYAVLLLLLRMGLRCQEVAALLLEDLDWVNGAVVVHGKGARVDTVPLPVDVGTALAGYLRHARPQQVQARQVFIRLNAPLAGLTRTSVSCIVGRLARKAGLGTVHAHRLRHTAASNVLNGGASLEEVAQFLRHASSETSTIYAKTDMTRLAGLSRPWPTPGDQS